MTTSTLHSARLTLEPYVPGDEEDFVALFQDERVSRWMGDGPATEAEDRALFWRVFSQVYDRDLFDVWAVRCDGRYVGHAEIKRTDEVRGHEIIYALAPDVWGAGLGRELAETIIGYGFGTLRLGEVHATVAEANTASVTLLGRLGFVHVRDIAEDDGTTTLVLTRTLAGESTIVPSAC
ncbi:GNAT family N-acetyltransferase [Streptomyces sp. NPDC046887]|uniref:GNAT family N-acetyltransferase n=1 Tax=Streptomyces sp. NPDC046887 TaxID=3155472 RepID=UPI0033E0067E